MNEENIIIHSTISTSDYSSLRSYYMYKRKPRRTRILVFVLLSSFALLVISETAFAVPFFRQLGIIGIIFIVGLYFWISLDARKLGKGVKNIVNRKQELSLSEKNISVKWEGLDQTNEYTWSDIDHAVENDSQFFLFTDQYFVAIIPKMELREYRIKEIHKLIERHVELISDMSGWKPQGA